MPKLTVNDKTIEVESGTRLVLAIEQAGVRIGHRCGGKGECTSCQVEFLAGEPPVMTQAEYDLLTENHLPIPVRLACQIEVDRDMTVRALLTAENQPAWQGDTGPEPEELVEPEAVWYPVEDLSEGE